MLRTTWKARIARAPHHRPAGFSLIELLVVISIIALMVGILLPALAMARESARNAQCLGNTRAIAVVMELYAQDDADHVYPPPACL